MANPCNGTGTITSVDLWFYASATGVKVATFSKAGSIFTPRAVATIGNVTSGSVQTFPVTLAVNAGDYIGVYFATGQLEIDGSGGVAYWGSGGPDYTDGPHTYVENVGYALSVYGTGTGIV
jgi:hypothetical protein